MSKEQNLKAVPYQDILDMRSELIKLRSWQKSYQVFSGDFEGVLKESEEIVARMVQRGKI